MYTINDSINSRDIKEQLTEMNARFDNEHLKLEQQEERNRNILIIVSIIITALVIFIIFRYIAAKRLKMAHAKLEDAHQQLLTAYDQLEETTTAKERIESELRIARDIQMGMVPREFPPFPERTDIDLYGSITPAKAVGGDLYEFFILDEKLYFCLGDVSGKGVPASLFMAVAISLFRVASKQQLPPAEIATRLNSVLAEHNENSMFVTMFIGIADLHTGRLEFCNAGHNPPVVKDADGHAHFLQMKPNAPLGFWPGLEYQGECVEDISMKALLIYSDGLTEAEDADKLQFGDEHLLQLMEQFDYEGAEQTIRMLNTEVENHVKGAEQSDDLTMLCLRIKGNLL
jgi:serine phosphatase RsbU (regulator of sigma subunit)